MKIFISEQHSTLVGTFRNERFPSLQLGKRLWITLVGVMSLVFPGTHTASAQDPTPAIRVRVDNYTKASPAVLATAEREAARILAAAGLPTIWLDCPEVHSPAISQDPCLEPLEPADIALRVVSQSTQNRFQDTVFGFAAHPILATVYYDYPVRLARSDNAEPELPIILGCVIAHELGHLLLGSNSHSGSGIMQPRWERKQIRQAMTGSMLFTRAQARRIQSEAQSRMSAQPASLRARSIGVPPANN
jgi:hypothetical protein